MITQLDTENADRNLTSAVTCLTHTPSTTLNYLCQALVKLGDGTKNLTSTGGNFEFTITIGGQTLKGGAQTVAFGTEVRAVWSSDIFSVPLNNEVIVKVKSPNGGDTDVDTTAYLYAVNVVDVAGVHASTDAALALEKAAKMLAHKTSQDKSDGTITIRNAADDADEYTKSLTNGASTIDYGAITAV
jgi:hypothetical protein